MAVQFSNLLLDKLLVPGISSFNSANVPDILSECPESEHWISNLFLNSLFGSRYKPVWQQAAVSFLFRTQTAIRAYQRARVATNECVNAFQPGRPASKLYFQAVAEWETVLLSIQIALDLYFKVLDKGAPETDDATRIRLSANRIKHFAEDIDAEIRPDLTIPIWLTADRLETRVAHVTYKEVADNLIEMSKAAILLQNPTSR